MDALIRLQAGVDRGQAIIGELDERFLRDLGHATPHARGATDMVGRGYEERP